MQGFRFTHFDPSAFTKSKFQQLLDLFLELLTYTSGDFNEAMQWLNQLDQQYQLTNENYGIGDFLEELKDKGYINDNNPTGEIKITGKTEQGIRQKSLERYLWEIEKINEG